MLARSQAVVRPRQPQLRRVLQCAASLRTLPSSRERTAMATAGPLTAFHTARDRARIPSAGAPASEAPKYRVRAAGPPFRAFSATPRQRQPDAPAAAASTLPDLDKVAALVNGARDRLLGYPGIPSEEDTATALRICAEAADLIMDAAVLPQLSNKDHQADTAASTLLSLDGKKARKESDVAGAVEALRPFRHVIDQISDAAYAIAQEPRVFLTARLLEQYVQIQARLGRPESLPRVLDLYATKAAPRKGADGAVTYKPQNPARPSSAVDADVAELALDAALSAQNLDAAVGVVEHTYAAPAFVRAKLLKRGFLPAFVVGGVPMATYILASQLGAAQQNMDPTTATSLAFAAILAYIAFTGTIGVVANTTANDQMKRVTWAPGTPLRERWLREEERAALDAVACAFGFREVHRYGEEEGGEFRALREYIMNKGMLLDQVELMEGMGS